MFKWVLSWWELGLIDDIYLTGEENDNGQAFALDPHNNILYTIPVLGRCEFENLALLELENPNLIAIVIGADTPGAPLFLYVGENDSESDNFLSRNNILWFTIFFLWLRNLYFLFSDEQLTIFTLSD